eukprot:1156883-Pelagomonas_calceolata.AAC.1
MVAAKLGASHGAPVLTTSRKTPVLGPQLPPAGRALSPGKNPHPHIGACGRICGSATSFASTYLYKCHFEASLQAKGLPCQRELVHSCSAMASIKETATQTVFAWQQYIAHVLPTMSDLTCLLTFNDQEVAQLQDSELKVSTERAGEATRQRAWAIELHKAWLAPLGLAFGINDSLWALGQFLSCKVKQVSLCDQGCASRYGFAPHTALQDLHVARVYANDSIASLKSCLQVRSRSFEFGLRSGVRVFLIAPFMDLANHCHRNFNCEPVMEEGNGRLIKQQASEFQASLFIPFIIWFCHGCAPRMNHLRAAHPH